MQGQMLSNFLSAAYKIRVSEPLHAIILISVFLCPPILQDRGWPIPHPSSVNFPVVTIVSREPGQPTWLNRMDKIFKSYGSLKGG